MNETDKNKWNNIYASGGEKISRPCHVLSSNSHLLPATGNALDLACGRGANAIYLAGKGYETFAWDLSDVATQDLANRARKMGLSIKTEQRDLTILSPPPRSFDIIVISRYLDRMIIPDIIAALRENGLLFYQTFIREKVSDFGPRNPAYRLQANELLTLFQSLRIIYYREEGTVGDAAKGFRDEAMLIAQKRAE